MVKFADVYFKEETDKDRFIAFVNGLNKIKLNQITEDWGDMHGVTISTDYSGTTVHFYAQEEE